ncbi:T9SS type A sorting domain-containing protein [bacterium]|nr:T9SS type A sorting domain-containing protein [bacterium]
MKKALVAAALLLVSAGGISADTSTREARHRARFDTYPPVREATNTSAIDSRLGAGVSLLDDIAVSESVAPAQFDQANADVIRLSDGGWLTVWDDDREGVRKIFWQRYSSAGAAVGGNIPIAGSTIGADYVEPKVETDTLGRVYLFYRDRTNGLVFGRRYLANLTLDLSTYLVNDTLSDAFGGPFDVAVYPNGRAVVVWENYVSSGSGIQVRVINSSGVFVTGALTVNTDGDAASHWVPSVAVEPNAGFLIAWEDYRNGRADIYARLYDGTGSPLASEFALVPSPANLTSQYTPEVACLGTDRYAVAWVDLRLGQDIYLQRYNTNAGLSGENQLLSNGDGGTVHWDVDVSVDPDGRLIAAWASFEAMSHILALRFDPGTNPIGSPSVLNALSTGQRWSPSVAFDDAAGYSVAWSEVTDNQADLHLMAFDSSAAPQWGSEQLINDDQIGAESRNPAIAASGNWYTLFAYGDSRRDDGDIYIRSMTHDLTAVAPSQRANQDNGAALQSEADIDAVMNDEGLVVWIDGRSLGGVSGQRIFGRYVTRWGGFVGDEFTISDSTQIAVKSAPQVALNSGRRGLVTWLDKRSGSFQVYGRWLNADHSRDGAEFMISDGSAGIGSGTLRMATAGDNRFYVSWINVDASPATVHVVWYRADNSLGDSFSYAPTLSGGGLKEMDIDGYADGSLVLAWSGLESGVRRLYLSVLDSTGVLAGSVDVITDSESSAAESPSISVDENDYVSLAWTDHRDGKALVYYQILDDSRTALGANEAIGSISLEVTKTPVTTAARGRAWFGWVDNRADGFNVYGANALYLPTDIGDDPDPELPGSYALYQNYPNPFNPTTTIAFSLPRASRVSLTVFNLLGQEVRVLSDGVLAAGIHDVVWDGQDSGGNPVASGVYFYRLSAGEFTRQHKMILLK